MITETFGKSTSFYTTKNGVVDARVEVTIDWEKLTRLMGAKAFKNKNHQSALGVGVKVRIVDAKLR